MAEIAIGIEMFTVIVLSHRLHLICKYTDSHGNSVYESITITVFIYKIKHA
jgi:hypothetical protein